MKSGVIHSLHKSCPVPFGYKSTCGKYHSMLKVIYTKLEMQRIIDAFGQTIDFLFVNCILFKQTEIMFFVMQFLFIWHQILVSIHKNIRTIVKDANNTFVLSLCNTDIFHNLIYLRLFQFRIFIFSFQNNCRKCLFIRQIPSIWFVVYSLKTQLIKSG